MRERKERERTHRRSCREYGAAGSVFSKSGSFDAGKALQLLHESAMSRKCDWTDSYICGSNIFGGEFLRERKIQIYMFLVELV